MPESPEISPIEGKEFEKEPQFDAVMVCGMKFDEPAISEKLERLGPEGTLKELVNEIRAEEKVQKEYKERELPLEVKRSAFNNLSAFVRIMGTAELWKSGVTQEIVVSGGKTAGEDKPSEAEAFKNFLVEHFNVPDSAFRLEEQSTNTIENFAYTSNTFGKDPDDFKHIAALSNRFHLVRMKEIANLFGIKVDKNFSAEDLIVANHEELKSLMDEVYTYADRAHSLGEQYAEISEHKGTIKGYQLGENLWRGGLKLVPEYWVGGLSLIEDNKKLLDLINKNKTLKSFLIKQGFEKVDESNLDDIRRFLGDYRKEKRELPPEEWASFEGWTKGEV